MAAVNLGSEGDGFQEFSFGEQKITIDVFDALNKLQEIRATHAQYSEPGSFWIKEVVSYLEELGLKNISTAVALKFIKVLNTVAEEVKKNIGLTVS